MVRGRQAEDHVVVVLQIMARGIHYSQKQEHSSCLVVTLYIVHFGLQIPGIAKS